MQMSCETNFLNSFNKKSMVSFIAFLFPGFVWHAGSFDFSNQTATYSRFLLFCVQLGGKEAAAQGLEPVRRAEQQQLSSAATPAGKRDCLSRM